MVKAQKCSKVFYAILLKNITGGKLERSSWKWSMIKMHDETGTWISI